MFVSVRIAYARSEQGRAGACECGASVRVVIQRDRLAPKQAGAARAAATVRAAAADCIRARGA
ncbi:hypothetical protein WL71_10145 [Burkholderia ubonensis]|uniref:Uncharacterized protein n=1 Tax=Burkholderia ubonensis TaxID=101571 RepID=A0A107F8N2_9BURK|nr:hypothetical protein WL70_33580 [Burkholderia ubonensis]KWD88980.1 hypothetical protein WL71_10145 [Burkholderia ubonensis]KWD94928.1 hypothetical protein WL72_24210 [Burkholderia ubonensis]KWE04354.1 hypothetical protein WL73_12975 [Burkholderia ubonensis]KWN11142.1 hypothetical protein WM21_01705 [Burkholderia ubonensis]